METITRLPVIRFWRKTLVSILFGGCIGVAPLWLYAQSGDAR
jgi:hypothetical protein